MMNFSPATQWRIARLIESGLAQFLRGEPGQNFAAHCQQTGNAEMLTTVLAAPDAAIVDQIAAGQARPLLDSEFFKATGKQLPAQIHPDMRQALTQWVAQIRAAFTGQPAPAAPAADLRKAGVPKKRNTGKKAAQ